MKLKRNNCISFILVTLIFIYSMNIQCYLCQNINNNTSSNEIIIWNNSTSGDIINNDLIVGSADGNGNITLLDNYIIEYNDTLIIEPGVKILLDENIEPILPNRPNDDDRYGVNIFVYGKLLAIGTFNNTITLTSKDYGERWGKIKFEDSAISSESELKYCKIEYGQISCIYSSPNISNNILENSSIECHGSSPLIMNNSMINDSTIICRNSASPIISNNIIFRGTKYCSEGIKIYANSNPIITNNSISEHTRGIIFSDTTSIVIKNNIIFNNSWQGIYAWEPGIIKNNTFFNNHNGISCTSSGVIIENNKIFSNKEHGIYCSNSNPTIKSNIITNNGEWGIFGFDEKMTKISNNTFVDEFGNLNKKGKIIQNWEIIVNVFDNEGNIIPVATVTVFDRFNNLIEQNSSIYHLLPFSCLITEYYISNNNTQISCNPHKIFVSLNNFEKSITLDIVKEDIINISLEVELPDLNITSIILKLIEDNIIEISPHIENDGLVLLYPKIEYYIDNKLIYSYNKTFISSDGYTERSIEWKFEFGIHLIKVIVDGNNLINETNEDNNFYEINIEIFPNGTIVYLNSDMNGDSEENITSHAENNYEVYYLIVLIIIITIAIILIVIFRKRKNISK